MTRLRLTHLIQADIDRINQCAAWTPDQRDVWQALLSDELTDEGIMLTLRMSESRFRRVKSEIKRKIERILMEK